MADSSLTEGDIKFALTVLQSAAKDPSFNVSSLEDRAINITDWSRDSVTGMQL